MLCQQLTVSCAGGMPSVKLLCLVCMAAGLGVCVDCCIRLLLSSDADALLQGINIQKNQQLLVSFFASAVDLLRPGE